MHLLFVIDTRNEFAGFWDEVCSFYNVCFWLNVLFLWTLEYLMFLVFRFLIQEKFIVCFRFTFFHLFKQSLCKAGIICRFIIDIHSFYCFSGVIICGSSNLRWLLVYLMYYWDFVFKPFQIRMICVGRLTDMDKNACFRACSACSHQAAITLRGSIPPSVAIRLGVIGFRYVSIISGSPAAKPAILLYSARNR